jgi:hypothetical protein
MASVVCAAPYPADCRELEAEAEANWLERHQPELLARTAHYLLLSGTELPAYRRIQRQAWAVRWVTCRLTSKNRIGAPDSDWKWHSMAIKRYMLPTLAAVGGPLGAITADASEVTGLAEGCQ